MKMKIVPWFETSKSAIRILHVSERASKIEIGCGVGFALWAASPLLAWHRDHFSSSVADAKHPAFSPYLDRLRYAADVGNGTNVPVVLPGAGVAVSVVLC